jgi:capsular polysaccharide biosynthesis protein
MQATQLRYVLSLSGPLGVVRKWSWVVILLTILFTGMVAGLSLLQTPTYEASIKMVIGQERQSDEPGDLQNVVMGLQQLTQTVAEDIKSRPVADAVIQELGLSMTAEELIAHLRVEQVPRTQLIQVYYTDPSPERAQLVANTIGEVYSEQISEVSPSANNTITATVREGAEMPDEPVSPDLVRNVGLALVVGLMVGIGVAFLGEYLHNNWRRPVEETERFGGTRSASSDDKRNIKTKLLRGRR